MRPKLSNKLIQISNLPPDNYYCPSFIKGPQNIKGLPGQAYKPFSPFQKTLKSKPWSNIKDIKTNLQTSTKMVQFIKFFTKEPPTQTSKLNMGLFLCVSCKQRRNHLQVTCHPKMSQKSLTSIGTCGRQSGFRPMVFTR